MRISSLLAFAILSCAFSCKEGPEQKAAPPPSEETPPGADPVSARPTPAQDAAEPALRPANATGLGLLSKGEIMQPPVSWSAGITTLVFEAVKNDKGGFAVTMREGEETREVVSCEASYDNINAYLDSEAILYLVCETEHSEASPGNSRGVRLEWKDGQVSQAGSFENEGPPAYDTMDFGEGE